eukprot:scaffold175458_cov45-Cyclotella_meneghiniana.AAC.2
MAGYCPDEPLAGQPGASILAHACVLVVDHLMEHTKKVQYKPFTLTNQPETRSIPPPLSSRIVGCWGVVEKAVFDVKQPADERIGDIHVRPCRWWRSEIGGSGGSDDTSG